MQLRNKPIDRRRLSARDRSDFNRAGGNNNRQRAISRVKSYRGAVARRNTVPFRTEVHTPGTGGFTNREPGYRGPDFSGRNRQQLRSKINSDNLTRAKSFRPEKIELQNVRELEA